MSRAPMFDINEELSNLRYLPPAWMLWAVVIFTCVALIPLGLIIKSRFSNSNIPRIHIIQDMDAQPKIKPQMASTVFADGRGTRASVEGTIARTEAGHGPATSADSNDLRNNDHLYRGVVVAADGSSTWATAFPDAASVKVTPELINRGEARYNIYCAPCHGYDGQGKGAVPTRAARIKESFTAPANLTEAPVAGPDGRPVGHLYNTITNGNNNMKGYGHMIPVDDRWAIVAWVRVLQRHRNATSDDLARVEEESTRQRIAKELNE